MLFIFWRPPGVLRVEGTNAGDRGPCAGTWDERQMRWIEKKRNKNAILACASALVSPETLKLSALKKWEGLPPFGFFVFVRTKR